MPQVEWIPKPDPTPTAHDHPDAVVERARVLRVGDDGLDVEVERRSTCGGCSARAGCGIGLLSEWLGRRPTSLHVSTSRRAEPGDVAIVALEQGGLAKAALMIYLLPLAGFLLPPLLARGWLPGAGEAVEILLALVGLVLSMALVRRWARRHAPAPILLDIIPAARSGDAAAVASIEAPPPSRKI